MHPELVLLAVNQTFTGDIPTDVTAFLERHGCGHTATHCAAVADEARQVARLFGADEEAAETAGWLHDCSAVWPADQRAAVALRLGVPLLPEEESFPMIIHQKLSAVLGEQVFGISDKDILSAVGCHTTLKAGASRLDKVLFVADKLAWDQPGCPPWETVMRGALGKSLDAAALIYLRYLWERRDSLRVVHPWLRDAYAEFVAVGE